MKEKTDHFSDSGLRIHLADIDHSVMDRLYCMALLTSTLEAHALPYLSKFGEPKDID